MHDQTFATFAQLIDFRRSVRKLVRSYRNVPIGLEGSKSWLVWVRSATLITRPD